MFVSFILFKSFFLLTSSRNVSRCSCMTKKHRRKQKGTFAKKVAAAPAMEPVTSPTVIGPPPPDVVLQWAGEEPDYRTLGEYADSIGILREKGFSYREIADWLSEHGIEADHNAVYRAYTNSLSYSEAEAETERARDDADREQMRER